MQRTHEAQPIPPLRKPELLEMQRAIGIAIVGETNGGLYREPVWRSTGNQPGTASRPHGGPLNIAARLVAKLSQLLPGRLAIIQPAQDRGIGQPGIIGILIDDQHPLQRGGRAGQIAGGLLLAGHGDGRGGAADAGGKPV